MAACGTSLKMNGYEPYSGAHSQALAYGAPQDSGYIPVQETDRGINTQHYDAQNIGYAAPCENDVDDCVQLIRTTKRVVIPCKRKVVKNITVQVPRTVMNRVSKQMPYQDLEKRVRSVPYITQLEEVRYSNQNQSYTTLVPKMRTKMVPVTRRVPKTVWVNVTTTVPKQETVMVPEIRHRIVPMPYKVVIPQTTCRNETYHVPVTRYKTVYENIPKTIYEPRTQQLCTTVTKMVTRDIPVYNAVPRVGQSCPPQPMLQNNIGRDFTFADTNHAGSLQDNAALQRGSYSMGYQHTQAPITRSGSIGSDSVRRYENFDLDGPETPLSIN